MFRFVFVVRSVSPLVRTAGQLVVSNRVFVVPATAILLALAVASSALAQLDRFDTEDIGRYAMMARDASNYKEFGLTASQLDRLLENEILNNQHSRFGRENKDAPRRFLQEVYDVLDEQQEARLHQVMFQRWMNRDRIDKGIQDFAPESIPDVDAKTQKLVAEIEAKRKQSIADLPEDRNKQTQKLIEFLAWRWGMQIDWLEEQIGAEKTKQLVGAPVPLGYTFITLGDEKNGGTNAFGEPFWGGSYSGGGFQSWGRSNDVHHVSVSFDPATGKASAGIFRNRRNAVSDRPVEIPEGLTLAEAIQQLRDLEEEMRETAESVSEKIGELRGFRRLGPGANPRKAFEEARRVEESFESQNRLKAIELEKARIIVTKLGGDPDAEKKKLKAAADLFRNRGIACNRQPFVNHIDATAKQCDALDKIWDEFGGGIPALGSDKETKYHSAIRGLLDESQQALFDQLVFRRLWYSKHSESALKLAKIKLSKEQVAQVAILPKLIRETDKILARSRSGRSRMSFLPGMRMDDIERENEPYVILEEEFNRVLREIVGAKTAADLIGKPMEYDRDWKRPVSVPAGLTLEKARAEYDRLTAESRKKAEERRKLFEKMDDEDGFRLGAALNGMQPSAEEQRREVLQSRTLEKYRRYVEELGGTIEN